MALQAVFRGQQEGRGTVVQAGGVAGGDASVGAERGAQPREALKGGGGFGEFVAVKHHRVALALGQRYRSDLVGKKASGDSGGGTLLAAQGKGVLVFARDVVLVGEVFGGFAHGVGAVEALHFGVDESPSERGVVELAVAAKGFGGLGQGEWCAGHVLDASGQDEVSFVREDGTGCVLNGR